MDVRHIAPEGVTRHRPDALAALLAGPGLVWIDVAYWDADAARLLAQHLGLRRRTLHECAHRNHVPVVRSDAGRTFVVLHAPEPGDRGHVHFVELDQCVGPNWLLTVHGPMNPAVPLDAAYVETRTVARKLESGTLRPARVGDLSAALTGVLTGRLRDFLTTLTEEVWRLEAEVTEGQVDDPEQFLEELFGVRHGLFAVHTMATNSGDVYGWMARAAVFGEAGVAGLVDVEDQFRRIAAMADGQRAYLQGVIDYYQTRTSTAAAVAGERLAVIAAVSLPITALAGVLGMNVIVNTATQSMPLEGALALMVAMSSTLLVWTRRKGWW